MSDSPLPYIESEILRVNLTEQKITKEAIPEDLYRNYLGGRGLGVKILYDTLSPNVDALSAENLLVFAIGPLTAMPVPTAGRLEVITKSPLTGTIFDSNVGGYIGAQLRRAGYAAIIFEGCASAPVYLWINNVSKSVMPPRFGVKMSMKPLTCFLRRPTLKRKWRALVLLAKTKSISQPS